MVWNDKRWRPHKLTTSLHRKILGGTHILFFSLFRWTVKTKPQIGYVKSLLTRSKSINYCFTSRILHPFYILRKTKKWRPKGEFGWLLFVVTVHFFKLSNNTIRNFTWVFCKKPVSSVLTVDKAQGVTFVYLISQDTYTTQLVSLLLTPN